MKQVIVITGASSGFGALAARRLADAGHTVYAGMRAAASRNTAPVAAATQYSADHRVDLRAIEMDVASGRLLRDRSSSDHFRTRPAQRRHSQCWSHVLRSRRGFSSSRSSTTSTC
jgi:NAD(P)-dependent dehydrogenase (short-subunit alcohol dehydrogenase family)